MKIYSNKFGHMAKMATMTMYDKKHSKLFFPRTTRPIALKHARYGKFSKISNTLKIRTPKIIANNNFWNAPKISNSDIFSGQQILKFQTLIIL